VLEDDVIPNCYHFTSSKYLVKSPHIPVVIEGVRVPLMLDTGAEVSVLSTKFVQSLFPDENFAVGVRDVRVLGGQLLSLKGPVELKVEMCGVVVHHPFYFHDENTTFLMGFDLITAAGLIIDSANKCVWSTFAATYWTDILPSSTSTTDKSTTISTVDTASPSEFAADSRFCRSPTVCAPPPSHSVSGSSTVPAPVPPPALPAPEPPSSLRVLTDGSCASGPCADSFSTAASSRSGLTSFDDSVSFENRCSVLVDSAADVHSSSLTLPPSTDRTLINSDRDETVVKAADYFNNDTVVSECSVNDETDLPEHVNVLFVQTVEESRLDSDVVRDLKVLLHDHKDTFAASSTDLGFCPLLEHDIDTGDAAPIRQSPRTPPLSAREAEDEILNEMLDSGVIEPSTSPWASPVCLVKKRDGTYRFCVDYRRLNAVSKKDAFPVPDIQDALDHLRGARWFATIDLLSGYWQLGMSDRAKERSAFCTRRGLFQFTRMPFGLSGAPSSFCRLMQIILREHLWKICLSYLDDIIIFGRTQHELLERLRTVLDRLRQAGLKVKPSKCALFRTEIHFLGHQVSIRGIEPMADKIEAIQNWPTPKCLRDVRSFYGLASYYRKFVRNFAAIAEPLSRLSRKQARFEWSSEAQTAFDNLKQALVEATSLAFPCPNRPCTLDTDASDVAIGAILSQTIDGEERPIAFFSRVLNDAQRNYCTTRRELLAVIAALQHFRHYLIGVKVILRTDHHSLKWLNSFKRPEGILARWVETLAEFDLTIEHRAGRLHSNVDGVSRQFCKQCGGKSFKSRWVDELERADELTEPLGAHTLILAPEISNEKMRELQAEDADLAQVIEWLEADHSPDRDELRATSLDTRNLWSQRPSVHLHEGLLVRSPPEGHSLQLIPPQVIRRKLFEHAHAGPLSAHLGPERVLLQLKQSYYWPGVRKDVAQWCHECEKCATSKGQPTRPKGHLQKVITGAPLDIVAVDILSGLPVTPDGLKYIMVVSDYFTKFSMAFALPDAEASTCMRAMYNGFFAIFGIPRQIHTDQGKNFESKLFKQLCQLAGVEKTRTTAFHPQSDGQVERMNRTLLQMLRVTADDDPVSWPQKLETLMSAYRMTVHKVTGVTPNMAMFGREVLLPATLIAKPPEEHVKVTVPFVTNLRDTLREAHQKVRAATRSVARTQKVYYDKHSKGHNFSEGQLVYLFWPQPKLRQRFHKLTKLWTGPWKILELKTSNVVVIGSLRTRAKQTVHVDRLAPCHSTVTSETAGQQPTSVAERQEQQVSTTPLSESSLPPTQSVSLDSSSVSTRPRRAVRLPKALEPYILG